MEEEGYLMRVNHIGALRPSTCLSIARKQCPNAMHVRTDARTYVDEHHLEHSSHLPNAHGGAGRFCSDEVGSNVGAAASRGRIGVIHRGVSLDA